MNDQGEYQQTAKILIGGFVALCLLVGVVNAINKYFSLPDDNLAEEAAEVILQQTTGISVDLTPLSEEK